MKYSKNLFPVLQVETLSLTSTKQPEGMILFLYINIYIYSMLDLISSRKATGDGSLVFWKPYLVKHLKMSESMKHYVDIATKLVNIMYY